MGGDAEDRPLESSPDKADGPDASKSSSFLLGQNWRDLIPVIKIDVVTFANLFVFKIDLYYARMKHQQLSMFDWLLDRLQV